MVIGKQRELGNARGAVVRNLLGPLGVVDVEHNEVHLIAVLLVKLFYSASCALTGCAPVGVELYEDGLCASDRVLIGHCLSRQRLQRYQSAQRRHARGQRGRAGEQKRCPYGEEKNNQRRPNLPEAAWRVCFSVYASSAYVSGVYVSSSHASSGHAFIDYAFSRHTFFFLTSVRGLILSCANSVMR